MRRRERKLLNHGHWKCSWGEEEGLTKGPRADLEGEPWRSDKEEGGEVTLSKGCETVAPDRKGDMVVWARTGLG